ncbi:MAG: cytidine deaminase, partial [Deltaproteobacteria bacterium]|nr:cytidine deaminase [Deltaproteobacteria bacterium]
ARDAGRNSHSPYSGFKVGAAVLGGSGRVYSGCNVENASYPVSLCAERGALAAAVADGEKTVDAVLIVSDSDEPCPPCGMCRQALAEFGKDMEVILVGSGGKESRFALSDLLPESFDAGFLSEKEGRS